MMRRRIKGIGGERERMKQERAREGEEKRKEEKRKEQFIAPLQNPSIQESHH